MRFVTFVVLVVIFLVSGCRSTLPQKNQYSYTQGKENEFLAQIDTIQITDRYIGYAALSEESEICGLRLSQRSADWSMRHIFRHVEDLAQEKGYGFTQAYSGHPYIALRGKLEYRGLVCHVSVTAELRPGAEAMQVTSVPHLVTIGRSSYTPPYPPKKDDPELHFQNFGRATLRAVTKLIERLQEAKDRVTESNANGQARERQRN